MKERNTKKWIGGAFLILFVAAQFFGTRPPVQKENPDDLLQTARVPSDVAGLLRHACYDCHSNETNYPWYASIAPVSWLVYYDVDEGREELNFSEWNSLKLSKKAKMLDKINEEAVEEDDMPLWYYTLLHPQAKLSKQDRKKIETWLNAYGEQLFKK